MTSKKIVINLYGFTCNIKIYIYLVVKIRVAFFGPSRLWAISKVAESHTKNQVVVKLFDKIYIYIFLC